MDALMLAIPQLEAIRQDDPFLYEALASLRDAVNNLGTKTGVDPSVRSRTSASPGQQPANLPAPSAPATISVAQSNGLFFVTLGAASAPNAGIAGIIYGVDVSLTPSFAAIQSFVLGSSQYATFLLGNVTAYFRAWAKLSESAVSGFTYLGTAANPTAVTSAGSATASNFAPNVKAPYNGGRKLP